MADRHGYLRDTLWGAKRRATRVSLALEGEQFQHLCTGVGVDDDLGAWAEALRPSDQSRQASELKKSVG